VSQILDHSDEPGLGCVEPDEYLIMRGRVSALPVYAFAKSVRVIAHSPFENQQ